jgi:hypothetical protein
MENSKAGEVLTSRDISRKDEAIPDRTLVISACLEAIAKVQQGDSAGKMSYIFCDQLLT